jgi:hypothetical protein
VSQALQVLGAILILAAYVLGQFRLLDQRSALYLALNAIGSAVLAWLALADRQWGFLLLEGVWALVSVWGLIMLLRGRAAPAAHRTSNRPGRCDPRAGWRSGAPSGA